MKDIHDIIKSPVLTEKSYDQIPQKKYTFEVDINAHKTEIKAALEEIFGVKVESVNTTRKDRQVKAAGPHRRPDACGEESLCYLEEGFQGNRILREHGTVA